MTFLENKLIEVFVDGVKMNVLVNGTKEEWRFECSDPHFLTKITEPIISSYPSKKDS